MNNNSYPSAVLLISSPDREGIIAGVTDFIAKNKGNILYSDQHVDSSVGIFFMRIEWSLAGFSLAREEIYTEFKAIAETFEMDWKLYFSDEKPRTAIFVSKSLHCLYDILYRYR
ncbi:MAG: formyltetrahydrofolate deformylase, partial [Elusimicrobia bacterium]|nr:formyltetrahydrofolate deformylase [Elusimicrobiota bacterium]